MRTCTILLLLLHAATASAKDHFVDPKTGSPTGDGTATKPWRTIQEVIDAKLVQTQNWDTLPYSATSKLVPRNAGAPIKAGDTIYLRSGYHGELTITGHYNMSAITITAQTGHTPQLKSVLIHSGSNWVLRGLQVSPTFAPTFEKKTLIALDSHNYSGPLEQVSVEECSLFSAVDTAAWTADDWNNKACNGIDADGTNVTLRKNTLKNVNFGLSVSATKSLVERNTVENFSGDGMRGLGDYTTFQYNTVKNCHAVNANHDDGFQSWSLGSDGTVGTGQVVGIVLRGNRIVNYEDPAQPHRGTLQGIGCFDGMFVDWVVENNVIITDHWHGITLLGAKNCRVVNNTVIDVNSTTPGPPWIRVAEHKDGTAPVGCTVRNNLATAYNNASTGVTSDHNLTIKTLATYFVDPVAFDLHLLTGCQAVDTGSATLAPTTDIEGTARPQGSAVDVGAYEWHPPLPDGAVGDSSTTDTGLVSDGPRADGAAQGDGVKPTEDGSAGGDDALTRPDDGCSCALGAAPAPGAWLLLLLLPWCVSRR